LRAEKFAPQLERSAVKHSEFKELGIFERREVAIVEVEIMRPLMDFPPAVFAEQPKQPAVRSSLGERAVAWPKEVALRSSQNPRNRSQGRAD
jgi:hypothetical protein